MDNPEPHVLAAEIETELNNFLNIHQRCSPTFLNHLTNLISTILSRSIDLDSKERIIYLKALKKNQLQEICRSWNLMLSGNKPDLINRITQRFSYASDSQRFFVPNFKCYWFQPMTTTLFDGKKELIECHHSKNKIDVKCSPEACPLLKPTTIF